MTTLVLAALLASGVASGFSRIDQQEVVADIRVHGNVATPDQDIITLAGISVGAPLPANAPADIAARLRASKKFEKVEVLKRFASIEDPTRIVLVIVVDEGHVDIQRTGDASNPTRVVRTHRPFLFLPILSAEDGYGLTYGVLFTRPDVAGRGSRLLFPATWGGEKRAAAELEKDFGRAARTRIGGGTSFTRRTNPFYDRDDDRGRVWARVEQSVTPWLRASATAGWQHVSFLDEKTSFVHAGADVTFDTRLDPVLARNAVFLRAAIDRYDVAGGVSTREVDARGYVGLIGQSVLVVRALRQDGSAPLPPYLQPMLGGMSNLRGFRAGAAVGDTLVAGSAELRLALTSPLEVAKLGVSAFVDAGAIYDKGQRFADQRLRRGIGGSVWVSAAIVRFSLSVAHGIGATTRVHFGGAVAF